MKGADYEYGMGRRWWLENVTHEMRRRQWLVFEPMSGKLRRSPALEVVPFAWKCVSPTTEEHEWLVVVICVPMCAATVRACWLSWFYDNVHACLAPGTPPDWRSVHDAVCSRDTGFVGSRVRRVVSPFFVAGREHFAEAED